MEEKLLKITDSLSIHVPVDISPAAEAQIVAMIRGDLENPERMEAEVKQLMKDYEEGRTIPADQVMRELDEMLRDLPRPGETGT